MRLRSIVTPLTEFDHPEKGDALYCELMRISFLFAESDLWIRMGSECQVPQTEESACVWYSRGSNKSPLLSKSGICSATEPSCMGCSFSVYGWMDG